MVSINVVFNFINIVCVVCYILSNTILINVVYFTTICASLFGIRQNYVSFDPRRRAFSVIGDDPSNWIANNKTAIAYLSYVVVYKLHFGICIPK